jgi:hypothetical protein
MKFLSVGSLLLALMVLVSCSTGSCRQQERAQRELQQSGRNAVRVFKYDGSKQCEGGGVSVDDMAKELAALKVLSKAKLNDGMMRTQVCGNATGMANVFEIPLEQLSEAERLGFRVWRF